MKFKNYLLTEGRSEALSYDDAMTLLRTKCTHFKELKDNTGGGLYRGVKSGGPDYMLVKPSQFTRTSLKSNPAAGGVPYNYYTLIMDNSPYFKKYPKRSQSIICASNRSLADIYGDVYQVYPFDGSKIVECASDDIWDSFEKLDSISANLSMLTELISKIFKYFGLNCACDDSYSSLISELKKSR